MHVKIFIYKKSEKNYDIHQMLALIIMFLLNKV